MVRSAGSDYNFVDPPVRDVVSIGNAGDNVTVRFVSDRGVFALVRVVGRRDECLCAQALRWQSYRLAPARMAESTVQDD